MATDVRMPRLSLTMESGVVLQWLKKAGDPVSKGEELVEIETDKAGVAMESPVTGYVRRLLVEEGADVACDTVIAIVTATADEALDDADGDAPLPIAATATPLDESSPGGPARAGDGSAALGPAGYDRAHMHASPAAKHLAKQLGVDLSAIAGSGPGGRVSSDDVQRAADKRERVSVAMAVQRAPDALGAQESQRVPLSKMRAAIARRVTLSATTVPQFTVRRRVDMSAALRMRDVRASTAAGPSDGDRPRVSLVDVLHLAVVRALRAHPDLNASFEAGASLEDGYIVRRDAVNLGIAVGLPDGLLVPVIHDAHTLSLENLAAERARLQDDARAGRLAARALTDATFTISNLGTMGVDEFEAIVNPPEAAILAVGRMADDLVVRGGAIHTLPMMTLTVTADHRVLDGAQVARFLGTLSDYLDEPETLTR